MNDPESLLEEIEAQLREAEDEVVAAQQRASGLRRTAEGLRTLLGLPWEAATQNGGQPQKVRSAGAIQPTPRVDLLMRTINQRLDHTWTLKELVAEMQFAGELADLKTPTETMRQLANRAAQTGRIERIGVSSYRAIDVQRGEKR